MNLTTPSSIQYFFPKDCSVSGGFFSLFHRTGASSKRPNGPPRQLVAAQILEQKRQEEDDWRRQLKESPFCAGVWTEGGRKTAGKTGENQRFLAKFRWLSFLCFSQRGIGFGRRTLSKKTRVWTAGCLKPTEIARGLTISFTSSIWRFGNEDSDASFVYA